MFAVVLAIGAVTTTALPGKVVGRGSASGQFAIATAQADVKRPKALYVRFVGSVSNGTVIASCIKGFSDVSANSYLPATGRGCTGFRSSPGVRTAAA